MAFWSAVEEANNQQKLQELEDGNETSSTTDEESGSDEESQEEVDDTAADPSETVVNPATAEPPLECTQAPKEPDLTETTHSSSLRCADESDSSIKNNPSLLSGHELIDVFKSLHDYTCNDKQITTIGLVSAQSPLTLYISELEDGQKVS